MTSAELMESIRKVLREELRALTKEADREYLTVAEAASVARGGLSLIRSWLKDGSLKRYGSKGRVLVSRQELVALLEQRPEEPLSDAEIERQADRLLGRAS